MFILIGIVLLIGYFILSYFHKVNGERRAKNAQIQESIKDLLATEKPVRKHGIAQQKTLL
jgi:hypothetical protein|tara:strand:- start:7623 stop:7802 length:180 start_codon:yes stop_codon:yes gene_type:complete